MSDSVWKFFSKEKDEKAKCLKCHNKVLCCKGGSTSGLIRHMQRIHNINLLKRAEDSCSAAITKDGEPRGLVPGTSNVKLQPKLTEFLNKKQSLAEIVSRLAAVDGFTINGITNSIFIRQSLHDRGYLLPKGKTNVMKLINEFYEVAKTDVLNNIKQHKDSMGKMSITLDEWTSTRNRRYLNVNIHFNKNYINLGLIKINGSCTANETVRLLNTKLLEFQIKESDIVAATTDGAAVMVKFGHLSPFIHQLCYNHGIHLAVTDVIYKHNENIESESELSEGFSSDSDDLEMQCLEKQIKIESIKNVLKMTRTIVKFFKYSPKRNSILQEYVKEKYKVEHSLLLDCKTRWNSLLNMVERFIKLVPCIRSALKDLNALHLLDEQSIPILSDVYSALNPIKIAVETLGKRDANLVTADAILKFMFDALRENNTDLSTQLVESLDRRIKERRNIGLVSLTKYLLTLKTTGSSSQLPSISLEKIQNLAKEIFNNLFTQEDEIEISDDSSLDEQNIGSSIQDKLFDAINAALKKTNRKTSINLKKEFQIYEGTGNITKNLQKLMNALMTIQPTSIESERVFSSASNFCTKKRFGLNDTNFNCLCFYTPHYQSLFGVYWISSENCNSKKETR